MGSKKSKTTETSSQNSTSTVTPSNPAWIQGPQQNYMNLVNGMMAGGYEPFMPAGPNALQQQAQAGAAGLGGGSSGGWLTAQTQTQPGSPQPAMGSTNSGGLPRTPAPMGATNSGGLPRDPSQPARQGGQPTATSMGPPPAQNSGLGGGAIGALADGANLAYGAATAGANTAGVTGYNPTLFGGAQLGDAAQAQSAQLGDVSLFGGAQTGPAAQAQFQAARPAQLGQARGYNPAQAQASLATGAGSRAGAASLLTNIDDYMNPYRDEVIDATEADFDANAARQRAAMAAQAGRDQAFGGSGYAIQSGVFDADTNRARASVLGGLRSDAMNNAMGFSSQDADRRQQASITNAQIGAQRDITNAQLGTQTSQFNAGALNDAGQFGANAMNQFGLQQGTFDQAANLQNSQLGTQNSQFNTGQQNDFAALNSGYQQQAGLAGMDALNQRNLQQGTFDQQTNLQNTGWLNDFLQQQGTFNQQAGLAGMDAINAAGQFNANAYNQNSQFNAGQQDAALNRQMQGGGMLADIGSNLWNNQRADAQTQADIGNQAWQQEYLRQQAPLQWLATMQGLTGFDPNLYRGGTTNTQGTATGTSTSRSSDPWGTLMGIGQTAAAVGGAFFPVPSDERLKTEIETLGYDDKGRRWVSWRYLWDEAKRHVGVIAQEIMGTDPEAVSVHPSGYLMVDYGRLA